jgi:hypothetical protein
MNSVIESETIKKKLLNSFALMIGSEETFPLDTILEDDLAELLRRSKREERHELVNRVLTLMKAPNIDLSFFDIVFGEVDFSKIDEVEQRIRKFCNLCILEYVDIAKGFEEFSTDEDRLEKAWHRYYSSRIKERKVPLKINSIPPTQLYALGYLAYDQYPNVEQARKDLREIFEGAREKGKWSRSGILEVAKEKDMNIWKLWAAAGISDLDILLNEDVSSDVMKDLRVLDFYFAKTEYKDIEKARKTGEGNTSQYLSTRDIDVYVATSMRDVLDFSMNAKFLENLKMHEEIKNLNLTFFDPTAAYLPDRIQKGHLENIMIDRAFVTVYNAQEVDTFGKDAEAGIAHAFGKDVIIYVARLFSEDLSKGLRSRIDKLGVYGELQKLYNALDSLVLKERDEFLSSLEKMEYLAPNEKTDLSKPEKGKKEGIEFIIDKVFPSLLSKLETDDLISELIQKGYEPPATQQTGEVVEFCCRKIKNLEVRALMFQELHPLTFQISPLDGIARGVFVTRSVRKTAQLLRALLTGALEYTIREIKNNVVLCDNVTNSVIRAYPKAKKDDDISIYIKNAILDLRSHCSAHGCS